MSNEDRINNKLKRYFDKYNGKDLKFLYSSIVCSSSFDPLSVKNVKLKRGINFSFDDLQNDIFPENFSDFIITMILWCSIPSSKIISLTSFNSDQISIIEEKMTKVESALFNDAYVRAYNDYLINDATNVHSTFPSLNRENLMHILEQTSYWEPALFKVNSKVSKEILDNFQVLCKTYNYELFQHIYPSIILEWIYFYPHDNNRNIKTYYEQSDKLLLSLMLPPRTNNTIDASSTVSARLSTLIKKATNNSSMNLQPEIFNEIDKSEPSNNDLIEIEDFDLDEIDFSLDKIDYAIFNSDNDVEEYEYITDTSLEIFKCSESDLDTKAKQPSSFCKKLIIYADYLKKHPEKHNYINKNNILTFKNLVNTKSIFESYNLSHRPNKSLCLSYTNSFTQWGNLVLLATGLNKESLKIYGFESRITVSEIYSAHFSAYNEMLCLNKLEPIREMEAGEHFLSIEFIEKINQMIGIMQNAIHTLLQNSLQNSVLDSNKYPNQYDSLFDRIFSEDTLSKITHPLIIELANECYYANNSTWMDEM